MSNLNFEEERIYFTPIILYTDYINLQFNKYLKENFKNITPRDFTYLSNIFYHQNVSQRQLAELLYVSESNVAQIVKRLENNGLIFRTCDANNKSKKVLNLTEKGKLIVFSVLKDIYEWEASFFDKYDDVDIEKFKRIMYEYSQKSGYP
ncbi:MarR family winged helix-turn-helix transcriptional regulator [Methanobrevibacter millerae]|uniref:Transcriptional regulator MarR family n=1 Tax=Methanobrevibacter millerae TaxID=230361 RepID=A0A0U3CGB3_9EURY|nr:MarR family transcriptional regulator [Methanobrevibacter millerae]ALT68859.1 transcriptional regulator MarR family [Methanobrevibacter millerae]